MRVLSWGRGVQSTTLAVMSAKGLLPRLDATITADTSWERQATYEVGDFYSRWLRDAGLYVEVIPGGNVRLEGAMPHVHIPFWTADGGPLKRECTGNFKIRPIRRRIRAILGYDPSRPPAPPAGSVELWIGISWDEVERVSPSNVAYIHHRWPLIELRMTRWDCEDFLRDQELPIPVKSACIGCPYRSASEWLLMRDETPYEFGQACEFDEANRCNPLVSAGSMASQIYIWGGGGIFSPEPLADAKLEAVTARERRFKQLPLLVCNATYRWPE